jgi:hypothetical protein
MEPSRRRVAVVERVAPARAERRRERPVQSSHRSTARSPDSSSAAAAARHDAQFSSHVTTCDSTSTRRSTPRHAAPPRSTKNPCPSSRRDERNPPAVIRVPGAKTVTNTSREGRAVIRQRRNQVTPRGREPLAVQALGGEAKVELALRREDARRLDRREQLDSDRRAGLDLLQPTLELRRPAAPDLDRPLHRRMPDEVDDAGARTPRGLVLLTRLLTPDSRSTLRAPPRLPARVPPRAAPRLRRREVARRALELAAAPLTDHSAAAWRSSSAATSADETS